MTVDNHLYSDTRLRVALEMYDINNRLSQLYRYVITASYRYSIVNRSQLIAQYFLDMLFKKCYRQLSIGMLIKRALVITDQHKLLAQYFLDISINMCLSIAFDIYRY